MQANQIVREFIENNLTIYDDEAVFSDSDNIFELGFVNSLFAMQLLTFVQTRFNVAVADEDIEIANFSSVERIVNLIDRIRSSN